MPKHPNAGTVEFYRERHAVETPLTLEVLRALPADKLAYKPHEQSSSAEAIFWTIVRCLITRNEVAAVGEADLTAEPPPSYRTMLAQFEGLFHCLGRQIRPPQSSTVGADCPALGGRRGRVGENGGRGPLAVSF